MDVKLDISENAKFVDKISVLGVATEDKKYAKNVVLTASVKRRITDYSSKVDEIHAVMVFELIKNDLSKYESVQLCNDVGKVKLRNNLRKLFKDFPDWQRLDEDKKIKIRSTKGSYVDGYVKGVRESGDGKGRELSKDKMNTRLSEFEKKETKKNKGKNKKKKGKKG